MMGGFVFYYYYESSLEWKGRGERKDSRSLSENNKKICDFSGLYNSVANICLFLVIFIDGSSL